ncbi:MAG: hypothetical protein ACRDPD_03275 [Streptosporangiaceae bacterium]
MSPERYLGAADRLLTEVIAGARGTWPRACAWLIRLALETALAGFWESACPPIAACHSRRAQFLLLPRYCDAQLSHRLAQVWAILSEGGHHHAYELGLTAAELRRLRNEAQAIITGLREATPEPPG